MATDKQDAPRPTSAGAWKGKGGRPLELPSGNVCLVNVPGIQHFLRTGMIPNSLKGLVQEALKGGGTEISPADVINDESDLEELLDAVDRIVLEVVIQPKVLSTIDPETGEFIPLNERDEETLYIDDVDLIDKMFIFQFAVGGTRDLESFRQETEASMGTLQSGEGVADTA